MGYIIRDREAGNVIEETQTLEEAKRLIAEYEREDKEDGSYTPDFYEIIREKWEKTNSIRRQM